MLVESFLAGAGYFLAAWGFDNNFFQNDLLLVGGLIILLAAITLGIRWIRAQLK